MRKILYQMGICLHIGVTAAAQIQTISGPTCAPTGVTVSYTLSSDAGSFSYCVSRGTLSTGGTCSSSTTTTKVISVTWNTVGAGGSISLTSSTGNKSLSVSFASALTCGSISSGNGQTINYNTTPAGITCGSPTGGACGSETYTYQWMSSTDNTTFSNVSGATSASYSPASLTSTKYFKRQVTVSTTGTVGYSDVATVTVYPQLLSGTISPSTQNLNYNTTPAPLSASGTSGGTGTYSYQWYSSTTSNGTYTAVSGATSSSYSPPALTSTLYYELVTTSNGVSVTSSPVLVNVYPQLTIGSVAPSAQTINYSTTPASLTVAGVSGGNGTYTYQWYSGTTSNGTYTAISGATAVSYAPPALTSTLYYQLVTTSNGVSVTSSPVSITVYPPLVSGSISPGSTAINYNTIPAAMTIGAASGGNGTYSYQWQINTGSGYSSISGATGLSYTPSTAYTSNLSYQVVVTSNGASVASAPVSVTVYPKLLGGHISIAGGVSTIPYGMDAGYVNSSGASGGNGTYSYQWQGSGNAGSWTSMTGNGLLIDPGTLYSNLYLRMQVTSNGVTAYSDTLLLTVGQPGNTPGADTVLAGTATLKTMPAYPGTVVVDNMNYIRTRTISKPAVTDTATANALTGIYDVHQVTGYMDGLGRSVQTVDKQATASAADLISTSFYDSLGRIVQQFMPYTDNQNTGLFRLNAASQQPAFYNTYFNNTESYYYSNTLYEVSPLQRVSLSSAPGKSWTGNGRGVATQYLGNTTADSVRVWNITYGELDLPTTSGIYAPGALSVLKTTDDNGHLTIEYKDMEGQLILKKVQSWNAPTTAHMGWLCTYYVYDIFHNLRCVMTPKAVATLIGNGWSVSPVSNLCYLYAYDARKRTIIRKIPDAAPVYIVYNLKDLPVLTQDGNMRGSNQWLVTRYDSLERPVTTGIYAAGSVYSVDAMQALVDANQGYPSGFTANTQNYYDDYSGVTVPAFTSADVSKLRSYVNSYPDAVAQSSQTRGLATISQSRVLEAPTTQWLTTVSYYDDKGRVIQVIHDNISGSRDTLTSLYDFSGKLLSTYQRHNNAASRLNPRTTVLDATVYDHMGRVTSTTRQLNDNGVNKTISTMTYDALGRMAGKSLGNNIETLAYEYNTRGWLKGVNRSYVTGGSTHFFGFGLNYDYGFSTNQFNGNVAGVRWKSAGDGVPRSFGYGYDAVNRLVYADFRQDTTGAGGSFVNDGKVDFDVPKISYDENGNILAMLQNGFKIGGSVPIDRLQYNYATASNQLLSVTDTVLADTNSRLGDFQDRNVVGNDYRFDQNGNQAIDQNKAIDSIRYNYLNQPEYIHFKGKGTISYVYDAGGVKQEKIVVDSTKGGVRDTTMYIGGFVYHSDTLQFIAHEEGRVRYVNKQNQVSGQPFAGFIYEYFLRDHLGNTRMLLSEEQDTTIYAATMEQKSAVVENQLFNNVTATQTAVPAGFEPGTGADTSNHYVSRLNGGTGGNRVGPSVVLKVMARDTVSANVFGWYPAATQQQPPGAPALVNDLLSTLTGDVLGQSAGKLTGAVSPVSNVLGAVMSSFLTNVKDAATNTSRPKAFINWVLFDNQLNYVSGGVTQVPTISAGTAKQVMQGNIPVVTKSGYLYIYVSNESNQDVYFDNLNVQFKRGPLLEENHYYPYGLAMAGITDKALKSSYPENKNRFNKGSELQSKEFADGSGLEMYETSLRELDPQLGRWWQPDPKPTMSESPYASMGNNPILHNDPLGDTIKVIGGFWENVVVGVALSKLSKSKTAKADIEKLSKSKNTFSIKLVGGEEKSHFKPDNVERANREEYISKGLRDKNDPSIQGGSGGEISWNPGLGAEFTAEGPLPDFTSRPEINLGHELLGHGLDADQGLKNTSLEKGLAIDEYQASHEENKIRSELGLPLRTYYGGKAQDIETKEYHYDGSGNKLIKRGTKSTYYKGYDYSIQNPPTND